MERKLEAARGVKAVTDTMMELMEGYASKFNDLGLNFSVQATTERTGSRWYWCLAVEILGYYVETGEYYSLREEVEVAKYPYDEDYEPEEQTEPLKTWSEHIYESLCSSGHTFTQTRPSGK